MQLSLDFCRNLTLVEAHDFPPSKTSLSEKGKFKCVFDIKPIFDDHVELKTKIATVDRRLTCSIPIEKAFYSSEQFSGKNAICAFCTTELTSSDAKELETLIQNE